MAKVMELLEVIPLFSISHGNSIPILKISSKIGVEGNAAFVVELS